MDSRQHKDRGTQLLVKGKLQAALEEFKKAVAFDPQDLPARRKVAELFARLGRIEDAIAAYQGLAGRYAVTGRVLEAIAVNKVILTIDPHHQQTQAALVQFAARREQEEQWSARLPLTMTALIEQERLREVPPPAPPEPSAEVQIKGGMAEPFPELPREVMIALLADVPRVASVVAAEECMLLEVTRTLLNELAARHPSLPAVLQRFYKERLLANLLRSSELFRTFDRAALARLVERFELRTAERGDELVRQGDTGRGLFVLLRGRCVAYDAPTGEEYPELSEGAVFGEIALLELCPATATVRAETRCVLLFLDRQGFAEEVLRNNGAARKLEAVARERLERSAKLLDALAPCPRRWSEYARILLSSLRSWVPRCPGCCAPHGNSFRCVALSDRSPLAGRLLHGERRGGAMTLRLRYEIDTPARLREHLHLVDGSGYFFFPGATASQGTPAVLEISFTGSDQSALLRGAVWARPSAGGIWLELSHAADCLDRLEVAPRTEPRVASDQLVLAESTGALLCRLCDVGEGGARLAAAAGDLGPPGARVRVALPEAGPTGAQLEAFGRIVWAEKGEVGVSFFRGDLASRAAVRRMIEIAGQDWEGARGATHSASCRCVRDRVLPLVLLLG